VKNNEPFLYFVGRIIASGQNYDEYLDGRLGENPENAEDDGVWEVPWLSYS